MTELRKHQIEAFQLAEWHSVGDSLEAIFYTYGPRREAIYANISPVLIDQGGVVRCVRHILSAYNVSTDRFDGHSFLRIQYIPDDARTRDFLAQANITLQPSQENALKALVNRGVTQQAQPVATRTVVPAPVPR